MSARGRRQAGINQQTQSLPAIVVPPLLMKPSLTNADECHLVNTETHVKRGGRGGLSSSLPPLFSLPAAFEKDEHSCINPVRRVLSLACLRRRGRARDGLTYQKSRCVTVSCCKAAGMTVMFFLRALCSFWHPRCCQLSLFVPRYKKMWS